MEIAAPDLLLYGGSFDPPHQGHLDVLNAVKSKFPLAKIFVIPNYKSPEIDKSAQASKVLFENKLKLCKLAFKDYQVLDVEKKLTQPNYSIKTIDYFIENKPKYVFTKIAFVMGQDQLKNLSKWFAPLDILEKIDLIIVKRVETNKNSLIKDIDMMLDSLGLKGSWNGSDNDYINVSSTSNKIYALDVVTSLANSSEIRNILKLQKKIPEKWLLKEVKDSLNINKSYLQKDV